MGPIKENGKCQEYWIGGAILRRLASKRKATDSPSTPSDTKRIKSSHSEERDVVKTLPKSGAKPIPFPEKVSDSILGSVDAADIV